MKKHAISFLLCTALVLSGSVTAFAAEGNGSGNVKATPAAAETAPAAAASMTFVGTPISLSLEAAIQHMQTQGVQAETLKINDLTDKQVADGYSEAVIRIHDSLNATYTSGSAVYSIPSEYTAIDEKSKRLSRDFAKANLGNNHQAELNAIAQSTTQTYYTILLAQDNLTAAKNNLTIQKNILANVQKKFHAGVAAKKDVLSAQTSVTGAESKLKSAEVALNGARMGFNVAMGYPLMQKVNLTDTLKEISMPSTTLADAIKKAKDNRLDAKDAALSAQIQEIVLNNMKLTVATNSATYLRAQVGYLQAKQAADIAPIKIEQDIRQQYMGLEENAAALKSAKESVAFAKEGFRLAQISYDAGVNTLTDVQQAQLQAFQADQALASTIQEYNLAIYNYEYAQGVGTKRVAL